MAGHLERKESKDQRKRRWKVGGRRSRGQRLAISQLTRKCAGPSGTLWTQILCHGTVFLATSKVAASRARCLGASHCQRKLSAAWLARPVVFLPYPAESQGRAQNWPEVRGEAGVSIGSKLQYRSLPKQRPRCPAPSPPLQLISHKCADKARRC